MHARSVRSQVLCNSPVERSNFLANYAPEFYNHLEAFPEAGSPNVEAFIYWSKERYGVKPVLSMAHVAIYKRTLGNKIEVLIASKQLYVDHYFEASLGLTAFVESSRGPAASGSYLL